MSYSAATSCRQQGDQPVPTIDALMTAGPTLRIGEHSEEQPVRLATFARIAHRIGDAQGRRASMAAFAERE